MDKIKVNNQVVKMRKYVKRAKLFAINKFTKQLKQLQNKKGNDSQAEKNKRKVERLLEKIKILKKMMPDFVSKKALSKAQDWNTLLAQKNIALEDQCLALLANDSEVQKEVERFCAEECHLVEKIPTLLLEWEVKNKIPKSPDKKKKASDIKRQKLAKIAERKKSNFKGATFPNNVAVDKSFKTQNKRPKNSSLKDKDAEDKNQNEKLEFMEDDLNENDQLNSESSNNSSEDETGEFFTKTVGSKQCLISGKQAVNDSACEKSIKVSDHGKMHSENSNVEDSEENEEPMEHDVNGDDQLNSESSNNSSDDRSEDFFTKATKSKKSFVSKERLTKSNASDVQSTEVLSSSGEEEGKDSSTVNTKNSSVPKMESAEGSTSSSQPSIFERLAALANKDTRKLKNKSNSRNTKAIKVLDLNELQDFEQIFIQSSPSHSDELDTPQTVVPKKDSFFLNGDEEVGSSDDDDESNTNNYKHSQLKRKFSNFNANGKNGKFKRNNFDDKPRKSFNSFKAKDYEQNVNHFQNRKRRNFNQNESQFQNKGKDFDRNKNRSQNKKEHFKNRFQENIKGDSQFKNTKMFDNKLRRYPHDDSFNQQRESKNSTMSNSLQSKKQLSEKGEKNANLHPSWEAKNKLKEAAKSGFKGKRIVFDV